MGKGQAADTAEPPQRRYIPEHHFSYLKVQRCFSILFQRQVIRDKESEDLALWNMTKVIRVPKLVDEISKRRRKQGWEAEAGEMETEQAVPGGNKVSGTCYELRERKAAATSLGDGSGILYLPGGGTRSYNGRH